MVTPQQLYALRTAAAFTPFRLLLTGGESVDVETQNCFVVGRRSVFVGLRRPGATDEFWDRWTFVDYSRIIGMEPMPSADHAFVIGFCPMSCLISFPTSSSNSHKRSRASTSRSGGSGHCSRTTEP